MPYIKKEERNVFDCVSNEFYRRFAVPHEDKKKEENGDID